MRVLICLFLTTSLFFMGNGSLLPCSSLTSCTAYMHECKLASIKSNITYPINFKIDLSLYSKKNPLFHLLFSHELQGFPNSIFRPPPPFMI